MNFREEYLAKNNGVIAMAAAHFARDLEKGHNETTSFEAGYEPANAIVVMAEEFPEVSESTIRSLNDWRLDG